VLGVASATALRAGVVRAAAATELAVEEKKIDQAVCDDYRRSSTWNTAWASIFGVAAVGSAGIAALAPGDWIDSDHRAGLYVTAAKATVGVVAKLVDPLDIDVEGACRHSRPASARDRHALLVEAARRERRTLIPNVVGGLAVNTFGLIYLGYVRGAWSSAWISFGIGSAVGVASAITAPLQSWLLKRRLDDGRAVAVVPVIGRGTGGVAMAGTW
jgi:hypothetical protein